MTNNYTLLRIRRLTARKLKILASVQGESMIDLVERLVTEEAVRRGVTFTLPTVKEEEDKDTEEEDV